MSITFRDAVSGEAPFILGIAGLSRLGKTYSALRLALGMAGGDPSKVFVIDTENGRATQYVERFGKFKHCNLEPPFSYDRYMEAVEAAVQAGAGVVVIDSMSHAHEGEGGLLEQHDAELERMAGGDWQKRERVKFAAWIKPKQRLTAFVQKVVRVRVPLIICFRAKDKMKLVKNANGRQEPVSVGMQPICSPELTYEMSSMLVLAEGARGVPDADASEFREPFDKMIPTDKPLDEDLGKALAQWAAGGAQPQKAAQAPERPAEEPSEDDGLSPAERALRSYTAKFEACGTLDALKAAWAEAQPHAKAMTDEQFARLTAAKDERKAELAGG